MSMFKGKVRVWVCKYSEAYVSLRYSLPPTGWYNPSYYSEVVRAELDKPLGHIRVLDTVPPHPLIARDRETEKVMEAIRDFKDWCSTSALWLYSVSDRREVNQPVHNSQPTPRVQVAPHVGGVIYYSNLLGTSFDNLPRLLLITSFLSSRCDSS